MLHIFIDIFVAVMATFGIYSLLHDIVDSLCRYVSKRQYKDNKAECLFKKYGNDEKERQLTASDHSGDSGESDIPKQR